MPDVTIKISGLGRTFHGIKYVVERALREAGCSVEVEDAHPKSETLEELQSRMPEYFKESSVKIVADHQPWGG